MRDWRLQFLSRVGGALGAAGANVEQARNRVVARRLQEFKRLAGHADEVGQLLAIDDLDRFAGVPAIHHDDSPPAEQRQQKNRMRAGDVKQRQHEQNAGIFAERADAVIHHGQHFRDKAP